jgi:hypothetical protein
MGEGLLANLGQQGRQFAQDFADLFSAPGIAAQPVAELLLDKAHGHVHVRTVQRAANRYQLACDVDAGLAGFDHSLDAPELPFGTLEAVEHFCSALFIDKH